MNSEGECLHLLGLFAYDHLPPNLQAISKPIAEMSGEMYARLGAGYEMAAGLRKLLEAKDCMVRAALAEKRWQS